MIGSPPFGVSRTCGIPYFSFLIEDVGLVAGAVRSAIEEVDAPRIVFIGLQQLNSCRHSPPVSLLFAQFFCFFPC